MKRPVLVLAVFSLLAPLGAQEIITADQYFAQVAEFYAQVKDYEGRLQITAGKTVMAGTVAWKAPAFLRIDFSQPAEQVIAFDGQTLVVYIPEYRAVLQQSAAVVNDGTGAGSATLATSEGLRMMKRSYTVSWETSPAPVPLGEGSTEEVIRLLLSRRTVAEGYRTIVLAVEPVTMLIRRIEGITLAGDGIVFDFTGIKTNQGIPEARFIYDSPASANVYNNFLFGSEN